MHPVPVEPLLDAIEALIRSQRELALGGDADALYARSRELAARLNELSALPDRSELFGQRERLQAIQRSAYNTGALVGQRHAAVQSAINSLHFGSPSLSGWNDIYAQAGFMRQPAGPRTFGLA